MSTTKGRSRQPAGVNGYRELFAASLADPTTFWVAGGAGGLVDPGADARTRRRESTVLPVVSRR